MLIVALGTNLGDRRRTLAAARTTLSEVFGPELAASSVVETPPWGVADQPDYLNQVVVLAWSPRPGAGLAGRLLAVLDRTQAIERALGRRPGRRWGPRACDIDLIMANDLRFESDRLSLPHPWWAQRDFVGGLLRRELADWLPPGH